MKIVYRCRHCQKEFAAQSSNKGRQFCSKKCKYKGQKRHLTLICQGCSKAFSILPCLKRKSNYCSVKCYHESTKTKQKRQCKVCHKEFYATLPQIKKGFGVFCSRNCQYTTYPAKISVYCANCKTSILVTPSKVKLTKFCNKKCKDDHIRDYVGKVCKNCHRYFRIPRWETKKGKGSFCSKRCFLLYRGETMIEKRVRYALQRSKIKFSQEVKIGTYRADFLLPEFSLIVECDGEYWHDRKPGVIARDKRKTFFLQNQGYEVIRLPEQTIRKIPISELQTILNQQIQQRQAVLQPQMPLVYEPGIMNLQ